MGDCETYCFDFLGPMLIVSRFFLRKRVACVARTRLDQSGRIIARALPWLLRGLLGSVGRSRTGMFDRIYLPSSAAFFGYEQALRECSAVK